MASHRQIAIDFVHSFDNFDIDANIALRAPDCQHEFAPSSLNAGSPKNNEQWRQHAVNLKPVIKDFHTAILDIFEGPDHVTVWFTSNAEFESDAKDNESSWEYLGEYLMVLVFDQRSDKIVRIVEFLDAKKAEEAFKLVHRGLQNLQIENKQMS